MPSVRARKDGRRRRLHVQVSPTCNNRCLFCLDGRGPRPASDFASPGVALEAYRWRDGVLFTCGEPTLMRELPALVARARELGYADIELVTNGRRLSYLPYSRALVSAGLTAVTISIHGDTSAVHDSLTRSPGSFTQSLAGLKAMARLKALLGRPRITASTVLTSRNMGRIGRTVEVLAGAGAGRVIVNVVEPEREALKHFAAVVPRMSEASAALLDVKPPPGVEYKVEGLPPCLMPGREEESGDREIIHLWNSGRIIRLSPTRRQTKGPPCAACALRGRCDGVWIEYVRRYGWDEFGQARERGR